MNYHTVIDFWFGEIEPERWWKKDAKFDHTVRERYTDIYSAAVRCETYAWRDTALGALAEVIVLDQFSRNMFRDRARAFAADNLALCLAQQAVAAGKALQLEPDRRAFLYMPFMHSESRLIHSVALELFSEPQMESNLDFELKHKRIIDRFGRYPHRNRVLGRESSEAELEFLQQPGSSF